MADSVRSHITATMAIKYRESLKTIFYCKISRSKSEKRRLIGISRSKSEKRTLCQRHRILEFPRDISRWYMPHTVCCLTFCGIIGMSHREESCKVPKSDYRWYICQR